MNKLSFKILRVGTAITFMLIGLMILQNPEVWEGFVEPWVLELLPLSLSQIMTGTGILDTTIGLLLLFNKFTWVVATVGSIHILGVLIVSGITDFTVRDIAILAGTTAISIESWRQ